MYLKKHLVTHTKDKLFKCPTCEKRFTQSSSVKTHMLVHTGKKDFQCEVCKNNFSLKGTLNRHCWLIQK